MSNASVLNTQPKDYHGTISANVTPAEAFDKICRVPEWWGTRFEGQSRRLNNIFTVRFANGDRYQIKIAEIVPQKKIVWQVIDSNQTWHPDSTEWTGTTIVWDIRPGGESTQIDMTHVGLVPSAECYESCRQGWDYLLQRSLLQFLTENKGLPV